MRTIHKYLLPIDDTIAVKMPRAARPMAVAEQDGSLCLWAQVETEDVLTEHLFVIRGTGHPLRGNEGPYIGTVVMSYGLVWHVYVASTQTTSPTLVETATNH